MDEDSAAAILGALANPARLSILRFLVAEGPPGANAGALARHLDASASRTSFHLKALSDAGILARRPEGRELRYSVDFARLGALVGWLVEDCCRGDRHLRASCAGC